MTRFRFAAALLLAGCAAAPAPRGPAPEPCPADAVPPARGGAWRLVRGEGFTFCVPARWRPAGDPPAAGTDAASWSGDGGTVAWGTGAYRPPERGVVTVEVRGDDPRPGAPGEVRRFSESIGGASADLWDDRVGERHFTGAHWTRPRAVHLSGEARDGRAAALQLDVYRTVRFPRR